MTPAGAKYPNMSRVPLQPDPQAVRGFLLYARSGGVLMTLVGVAVLVGWWWDIRLLITVGPGQEAMKASAAIGFVLSGLALLASLRGQPGPLRWGQGLSLAVAVLGLANLAQDWWRLELDLDRVFNDSATLRNGWPSVRMSQATASAFFLLGLLGFLTSSRRWLWLRELVAVSLLATAMFALAAHGFVLAGETSTAFHPVAIHTAILLLIAALGWMSSQPTTGLTRIATADTLGGVFARRLALAALLLPVAFTFAFKALQSRLGATEVFALSLAALFTGGSMAWMVWWVANLLDRTERQRREAAMLRDDARTDVLTGLANRRAFDAMLEPLLHGRREHDAGFSLLLLDVDFFKSYNDQFGHQAGDQALRHTGRLLRAALRPGDVAARYGGEEFAVLLPDTDAPAALKVAERILADFRAFRWPLRPITLSIGAAEARKHDTAPYLLHRADAALYQAKRAGRDRVMPA